MMTFWKVLGAVKDMSKDSLTLRLEGEVSLGVALVWLIGILAFYRWLEAR